MTTPGGDAIFRLRWEQENAQVPAQARAQLLGLAQAQGAVGQASRTAVLGWASEAEILQAMQRDAKGATRATQQLGDAHLTTGRGSQILRSALTGLAFEATGTAGPIGKLASGLLVFGAGGTVTLTVAAGLAIIAGGYRLVTKDAREATAAHQAFLDKLHETVAAQVPAQDKFNQAQLELANAREKLAQLEQHADLVRSGRLVGRGRTDEIALDEAKAAVTTAEALVQQLRTAATTEHGAAGQAYAKAWAASFIKGLEFLDLPTQMKTLLLAHDQFTKLGGEAGQAWADAFDKVSGALWRSRPDHLAQPFVGVRTLSQVAHGMAPLTAPEPRFLGAGAPVFAPFGTGPGVALGAATARNTAQAASEQDHYNRAIELAHGLLMRTGLSQRLYNEMQSQLQLLLDSGVISGKEFSDAMKELNREFDRAKKGSQALGAAIIGAVAGALAAIVSGGSAGGIISAIGGIISLIPGGAIAGAVVSGIGTVALGSESRGVTIDRYGQAALDQLKGLPNGPQHVELVIVSATTGEVVDRVIYTLGQQQNTDNVRRLPGFIYGGR